MSAFQSFIAEPLRLRRLDLALYRASQLLHDRTNGRFDAFYMMLARHLAPPNSAPAGYRAVQVAETVEQLRENGYRIMPEPLTVAEVAGLREFAFSHQAIGDDMRTLYDIKPDAIPEGQARFSWWMHDLAACDVVQRLLLHGPYCAIAQQYLGCRPVLAHISLFLDRPFAGNFEPYSYHYDNEGPGFLKFFFYLTDVEVGTGAHYFIAGTQNHTKPAPFSRAAIYREEDLFRHYSRNREVVVVGSAGTVLAEDTAGFHRGSKIERNYRLMMQFEFSALDAPTTQELVRPLRPIKVPGIDPAVAAITRKFYCA